MSHIYNFDVNGMRELIEEENLDFDDRQDVLRSLEDYHRDDLLDPLENEDEELTRLSEEDSDI